MKHPKRLWLVALAGLVLAVALAPVWLPWLGTALVVDAAPQPADVALVPEGTGREALQGAEDWRQSRLVADVVVVEAPIKTHALVAYWSDFIAWGLAQPSPTPPEHLRIVRAPSTQAAEQARAALPALQALGARAVLVPGAGIGSRLVQRELASVLGPAGISVRMARLAPTRPDPAHWYERPEDRRAVLDSWLQLLVPYLSGYDPATGS